MKPTSQGAKAEAFRRLHAGPGLLVLPNAWDVASARVVGAAGFAAIATSSAGGAWALGSPDGEGVSRREMLTVVRRIARNVAVPVSADMEAGYGSSPEAAAETARGVIAAGGIGLNLEDGTRAGTLLDVGLQVERIRAVREAAAAGGVPRFLNARTDSFDRGDLPPAERFAGAVRRAPAHHAAGAGGPLVPLLGRP